MANSILVSRRTSSYDLSSIIKDGLSLQNPEDH